MMRFGTRLRQSAARWAVATGLGLAATGLGGCSLLDVSDPTKLEEQNVSNAVGADLMRRRALLSFDEAESPTAWLSGVLADEFELHPQQVDRREAQIDKRFFDPSRIPELESSFRSPYALRRQIRYQATLALREVRAYATEARRAAHAGQMLAVRGYTTVRLGEDWCPGFPLHELDGFTPVYGPPLTTAQVFERALADLDSAVDVAVDSARILDFARIVRGRALLNLGRFAEAAAAVNGVPTGYVLNNELGGSYDLSFAGSTYLGHTVANQEGGNGLDFVAAHDPRLLTTQWETAADGVTPLYRPDKYSDGATPIVIAGGVEARLIEAEGALRANDPQWLAILNTLRTDGTFTTQPNAQNPALTDTLWAAGTGGVAGLRPLVDPGADTARVDLVFRERAFWLFGTGHRLGDLRRLVRDYGRSTEAVFPTGSGFGSGTSLPFPAPELELPFSPGVTGCTSS